MFYMGNGLRNLRMYVVMLTCAKKEISYHAQINTLNTQSQPGNSDL